MSASLDSRRRLSAILAVFFASFVLLTVVLWVNLAFDFRDSIADPRFEEWTSLSAALATVTFLMLVSVPELIGLCVAVSSYAVFLRWLRQTYHDLASNSTTQPHSDPDRVVRLACIPFVAPFVVGNALREIRDEGARDGARVDMRGRYWAPIHLAGALVTLIFIVAPVVLYQSLFLLLFGLPVWSLMMLPVARYEREVVASVSNTIATMSHAQP